VAEEFANNIMESVGLEEKRKAKAEFDEGKIKFIKEHI